MQIKTSIKPDEITKLFNDILETSVVSEVDEERTEHHLAKLMDLLHKFDKGHMIACVNFILCQRRVLMTRAEQHTISLRA